MGIVTELKNLGNWVATENDGDISLSYVQASSLNHGSSVIDEVSSESDGPGSLNITVADGAQWDPEVTAGNSSSITLTQENGDLTIEAPYPATVGNEEWTVSDGDAPPVTLKIKVIRR